MILIIIMIIVLIFYYYILAKETFIIADNLNIILYDQTTTINPGGYNIGDLLNMPSFWAGWGRNPHTNDTNYQAYLDASKNFPKSIIYYYSTLRTNDDEPIPNMNKIENAVDLYIENNDIRNVLNEISINNINNYLYVHLRSGDKGIVEDDFINKINELSNKYNKIVILAGVHSDQRFNEIEKSKNNIIESLKKINNDKIDINLDKADNHLVIMRKCKNLLLHKGGFSILGSIIFTGNNLYFTNLLETKNTQEIINHLKQKNINYSLI